MSGNRRHKKFSLAQLNPLTWDIPSPMPALRRLVARGSNQRSGKGATSRKASGSSTDKAAASIEPRPKRPPIFTWARTGSALLTLLMWMLPVGLAAAAFSTPLLGVQAYDYVMQTGHFHVRDVLIEGNDKLDYATIKRVADIKAGTHLLATDLPLMERRLMAHPWVSRATVRKELPDRLIIHLTEHKPTAYVERDGLLTLVNELGQPFAPLATGEMYELPIVTGISAEDWADQTKATVARATIRMAVNLSRLYRDMGMPARWPLAEIRVEEDRRLALVISPHGTEAVLGRGPYRQKLYRLEWVLENLHQNNKVADYVLLDIERGGTDDGRVIVRAEVAPTPSEQRKEARAFADKSADDRADQQSDGKKTGEKRANSAKPPQNGGAENHRDGSKRLEGLLPRMRRAERDKTKNGKGSSSERAPNGAASDGSGEH